MRKFKIDTTAPKAFTLAAKTRSKRVQLTYGEISKTQQSNTDARCFPFVKNYLSLA